jgi:hypothetical protein
MRPRARAVHADRPDHRDDGQRARDRERADHLADGKYYSFFLSGPYNTATKKSDFFILEDAAPGALDYAFAYVRFVNAISNSSPMTLYAKNTTRAPSSRWVARSRTRAPERSPRSRSGHTT